MDSGFFIPRTVIFKSKTLLAIFDSKIQEIKDRLSKRPSSPLPKKNTNSTNNECDKSLMIVDNNMILNERFFGISLEEKKDFNVNEF